MQRFAYDRCTQCGAYFLAARPIPSELGKVYFSAYGPYQPAPEPDFDPPASHLVTRAAALPLRAVGAALGLPGRRRLSQMFDWTYTPETPGEILLDYGCGAPTFLDDARERGFATIGVDFSEPVLEVVRASGHEAHLVGEDFERGVQDSSVSCVRMNHVIEHLYHPRPTLAAVRSKMRRGARIHISTPNPGSIGSRLFGRRWHALDCPRHVVLYLPRVLRRMLAQAGFHDVSVVHEVGPKDLTRSWGIVLYDRGRIRHEQVAAMATDPVRSGVFWPLASLGAVVGIADRYHVFARVA
jgi:2-polyprenyl-3-methyl-5-hydroxy-6-metoxy-1,4-benzoquinol methylase